MISILIVDDELFNRRLLRYALEPYAKCTTADNGKEGFIVYRDSLDQGERFDVVLLDIMMPVMDGFECLELIREFEQERQVLDDDRVKVLIVTTHADRDNVLRAKQANVDGFIVKPINRKHLLGEIRNCGINLAEIAD